jgi:hypothetical protein
MKKAAWCSVTAFAVALVVGVLAGIADANPWDRPSGWHYNLELIAVPKDKTVSGTDGNGHRIFIKLFGNTKILLTEGDFQVLDFNGTDGQAAFSLPANPCVDSSGNIIDCPVSDPSFQCYSVWVAELGKPCNPSNTTCSAVMTLCGGLNQTCDAGICSGSGLACTIAADCVACSLENVMLVRNTGQPKWRDVTKELTTLCLDLILGGSGCDTRIALFDPDFADFFWNIDNDGLRHAQLRFYPETGDACGLKPSSK